MAINNSFQPELLAPAGSEECVYAAVENGADAVYFGLSGSGNFNARNRAANISLEKLNTIMDYLHRHGVRGYVTLNTLVRNDELPAIEKLLQEIVTNRCDAVIVQDFGIARLAGQLCPDLTLHASTQMSLTSLQSIELAQTLGIRRVVLPRELSLGQIQRLCAKTTIELECFIHGALCISFSGQCYASLGLGGRSANHTANRSANRGCCAQPCRLPYSLLDASSGKVLVPKSAKQYFSEQEYSKQKYSEQQYLEQQFSDSKHFLSPCDLAALPILPQLLATGVKALKIEGRLKPPEYVAEVTKIYREAVDALTKNNVAPKKEQQEQPEILSSTADVVNRLELTFSRGFSTGWLEGIDPYRLVPGNIVSHRGSLLGTVVEMRRDAAVVDLLTSVRRGDGVRFENENSSEHSQGGRVYEIIYRRQSVPEAEAGARVLLTFANHSLDPSYILPGQAVQKTDDPQLQRKIRKNLEAHRLYRRIPLQIFVRAVAGEPIVVDVQNLSETTGTMGQKFRLKGTTNLETARKHPLSVDLLREQFGRLGETVYVLDHVEAVIEGNPMIPLSVLGQLRREMIEKLNARQPDFPKLKLFNRALESLREENQKISERLSSVSQNMQPVIHLLLRHIQIFENDFVLQQILESGCRSFYA
ncbi:MAG: U32 family peptidase, partial [Planctomycetaceae bacterium]|nr:U32 family peptidase [Planctomycetaceae bacterium]